MHQVVALNYVNLVCDLYDGEGSPVQTGTLSFQPTATLTDTTDHITITQAPVVVSLLGNPLAVVSLAATDNGNLSPPGWSWLMSAYFPGAPARKLFLLPFSAGATQYLSSLLPAVLTGYLPESGGTASGTVTFTGTTPLVIPAGASAGYVLTSDVTGAASWQSADAGAALPVFSARAFGAAGDGTTDDTPAAASAIGAAASFGGVAYFPPGTYLIESTLTLASDGITVQGAGSGATVIRAASGMAGSPVIQVGNGSTTVADCGVFDLMVDASAQKTGGAAIDISKGLRTRIQRVRTMHQYHSVHVHNSTLTWITDCDLRDQSADAIQFDSDLGAGNDLFIRDTCADNPDVTNSGNGINWTGGENLVVQNCDFLHFTEGLQVLPGAGRQCRWGFFSAAEFDSCSDNAWHLSNTTGDVAGLTFTNCWAGTAVNYGVLLDGSGSGLLAGIRVDSSKVVHNGLAGIRIVAGSAQVSVTGCDVISNSQAVSGARSGIEVTAGATGFLIEGCQIANGLGQGSTQGSGISFDAGATDGFVVSGNDLSGNVTSAIAGLGGVTGTSFIIRGNAGYGPDTVQPVASGGTGRASLTAYGLLAAGTTGTGAAQQVSGTGASGQFLTSNGAGALPSWATGGSGVSLDTTATDIQALGAQAAGGTGKAADAGHVHPVTGIAVIDATSSDIAPLGSRAAGSVGKAADAGHVHPTTGLLLSGATAGGDLSGTLPSPTVAKVNGVAITGTPTAGQVPTALSGGTAATWQTLPIAVTLDTTSADISALGVQAAGSTGMAADAGHVHPTAGFQTAVIDTTSGDIAALGVQDAGATGMLADAGHVHPVTGLLTDTSVVSGQFLCMPAQYGPPTQTPLTTTSPSFTALSSSNVNTGSFTVPPSGMVMVTVIFIAETTSTAAGFGVNVAAHGTTTPMLGDAMICRPQAGGVLQQFMAMITVTGLTAGATQNLDLMVCVTSGSTLTVMAIGNTSTSPGTTSAGQGCPVSMTVQAV